MLPAAIGIRMHSGWGALVAVSNAAGKVEVIERRRLVVTTPGTAGANQPYHFAENLELAKAERFLADRFRSSQELAVAALADLIAGLHNRRYRAIGSAVLLASGRPLPALEKILASHALIHTAEGEFFREVFSKASEARALPVTKIRERDLSQRLRESLGKTALQAQQQIAAAGRILGPPWTTDQKTAALAALILLADSPAGKRSRAS